MLLTVRGGCRTIRRRVAEWPFTNVTSFGRPATRRQSSPASSSPREAALPPTGYGRPGPTPTVRITRTWYGIAVVSTSVAAVVGRASVVVVTNKVSDGTGGAMVGAAVSSSPLHAASTSAATIPRPTCGLELPCDRRLVFASVRVEGDGRVGRCRWPGCFPGRRRRFGDHFADLGRAVFRIRRTAGRVRAGLSERVRLDDVPTSISPAG